MPYVTKQYQAVLQCVQSRGADAFTAAELTEDLRHTGHPVGLATVYRQLEKLEAAGMVHKVPTEEGALYQCCPHPQPDHGCILLRCEACGRITHLECIQMEALCMDPRRTILTGRCQHCAQEDAYGTP